MEYGKREIRLDVPTQVWQNADEKLALNDIGGLAREVEDTYAIRAHCRAEAVTEEQERVRFCG